MEVNKLLNGVNALKRLNQQDLNNITTALKLVKNGEEVERVLKIFNTKRSKILEGYDVLNLEKDVEAMLRDKIAEVGKEDIEIKLELVTIEELEGVKLTGVELASIMWCIKEKEEN